MDYTAIKAVLLLPLEMIYWNEFTTLNKYKPFAHQNMQK